jgi:hypothetical protein
MSKKLFARFAATILVALASLFIFTPAANAGVDDFEFESMHVDYSLSLSEHNIPRLNVTETLVAIFPEADQNRGIKRLIPDDYKGHGLNTQVTSVLDETGSFRDFTTESVDGFVQVISKHNDERFVHGRQTYVINYSQNWVVGNFGATDEFYWDVNGTGWAQPFGSVTATVTLAPELAKVLQTEAVSCYAGASGANDACDKLQVGDAATRIDFAAANLGPGETLTIDLPFKPGLINTGNVSQVVGTIDFALFWAFGAVILVVLGWALFYRIQVIGGRSMRKFIPVQYQGPETPSLAAVAQVISSPRWKSALLVQAAVNGYVSIANSEAGVWTVSKTGKTPTEPAQQQFLERLFRGGLEAVDLGSEIDEVESIRIVNVFDDTSKYAEAEALAGGYFSHYAIKTAVRAFLVMLLAIAGMLWTAISLDAVVDAGFIGVPIILGLVATFAHFLLLLTRRLPTQAGVDLAGYMDGLKTYIGMAEQSRLEFLQSPKGATREKSTLGQPEILHLYEQTLPWAILLGLEKEWTKVLATYYTENNQPVWAPIFVMHSLSLSGLDSAISQSLAVSSSSGSGGGGGGGGGV